MFGENNLQNQQNNSINKPEKNEQNEKIKTFENSRGEKLSLNEIVNKKITSVSIIYPVCHDRIRPDSKKINEKTVVSSIAGDISLDLSERNEAVQIMFDSEEIFNKIINYDDDYLLKRKLLKPVRNKGFYVDIHRDNIKSIDWE